MYGALKNAALPAVRASAAEPQGTRGRIGAKRARKTRSQRA